MKIKKVYYFYSMITCLIIISAVLCSYSNFAAVQKGGMQFIVHSEQYQITERPFREPVSFTLDWNNIEASIGKEIFRDDDCVISIQTIQDDNNGGYKIFFDARGSYHQDGARLITLLSHEQENADGYLRTTVGNYQYETKQCYTKAPICYLDGDTFAYSVFPLECYLHGQLLTTEQIRNNNHTVEIELVGLKEVVWTRI